MEEKELEAYVAEIQKIPKPGFIPKDHVLPKHLPKVYTTEGRVQVNQEGENAINVVSSLDRTDGGQRLLTVWFEPGGDRVTHVMLSLPDGVTPTDLSNFKWSKWIAIARAARVEFNAGRDIPPFNEMFRQTSVLVDRMFRAARPDGSSTSRRPGRHGHPDSYYQEVADTYRRCLLNGESHPIKVIAEAQVVSRNTASGWVREARKRGLLEPAHKGRAG